MNIFRPSQLQAVLRRIQLNKDGALSDDFEERITNLETAALLQSLTPSSTPHQAVNIIKNGDVAHSVHTYNDNPPLVDDDRNKEAAFWYSHEQTAGETMKTETAPALLKNATLKTTGHAEYNWNGLRCRWDREIGAAELCAQATIDTPIDQPVFRAGFTAHLVVGRIALSNKNTAVPDSARLFAGLWAKQAGVWDWVKASDVLRFSAAPSNPGTKEYRYRLHVRTDRGFEFLSDEVVVLNAPNTLGGNNFVQLNWASLSNAGITGYDLYRYDPAAGQYVELQTPGSASNYQDNGSIKRIVAGYPTGDFDRAVAYEATPTGELVQLPRNGVSVWRTLSFALNLPAGFNLATLESSIFVRLGVAGLVNNKFDLRLDDVAVTSGNIQIESLEGLFDLSHETLNFKLFHPTDSSLVHTGTIAHYTDAEHIEFDTAPNWSASGARLIISGGGADYGLLADLLHLSTSSGAIWAPHPEDYSSARKQFPASLPNGSTQGGTGTPTTGGDGGIIHCVWEDETAYIWRHGRIKKRRFRDLKILDSIYTGGLDNSQILDIKPGVDDVYQIETANGCIERCTKTQVIIRSPIDTTGCRLELLRIGDKVLTIKNGLPEVSEITRIFLFKRNQKVITLTLSARPLFVAGENAPEALLKKVWKRLKKLLRFSEEIEVSGIVNHNRKYEPDINF